MARIKCDVCVIGAGSGGLSVAAGAAQLGADTVLVEGGEMGGDCLNYGCVPSKALIASAKQAQSMRAGRPLGVAEVTPQIDYAAAKDHVREAINAIAPHDSQERFEGLGVRVIRAWGRFVSPTELEVGGDTIVARRFVVATGSRPLVPPIEGLEGVTVHTNETIFDLRERPDHLIVVGGGPIGCEMAQAHVRLGCRVTLVEGRTILPNDDPELVEVVRRSLAGEGVEILENAQVERVGGGDGITVHTGRSDVTGTHLLMAVGRKVNVDGLGLDAAGVAHEKGVTVDARLRSTTNKRVYAVGDAAGGLQFTHVAGYHGGQVVRSILFGLPARARTDHIPWATYTDPELAQVGLTEAQARGAHGEAVEVVRADYSGNDRAQAENKTGGFIKVMVVKGRPVGASIVGHDASGLIATWALAIANNLKMSAVSATILPYPTFAEINKAAASAYFGPRLFQSPLVKRVVGAIQRLVP